MVSPVGGPVVSPERREVFFGDNVDPAQRAISLVGEPHSDAVSVEGVAAVFQLPKLIKTWWER